jgi:hypothetical protein
MLRQLVDNMSSSLRMPPTTAASGPSQHQANLLHDNKHQQLAHTSINIFRAYIHRMPNGELDANGVTSEKCYQMWLGSRKSKPTCPEKAFQRALSGHITGVDGRVPFDQEEEEAILRAVRRKARWECFKHCDIKFGESGFRTKGFHEKAYTGEIHMTQPKKRAKRALEKIKKISRSLALEELQRQSNRYDDEDVDDAVEEEEDYEDDYSTSDANSSTIRRTPASQQEFIRSSAASPQKKRRTGPKSASPRIPCSSSSLLAAGVASENGKDQHMYYPMSLDESSAPALQMNIPTYATTPISSSAFAVLSMLVSTFLSLAAMGVPFIRCVTALTRTILLSRGWFKSPTMTHAEALMARLQAAHPTEYILLSDFTSDPSNRVMLQNDLAIAMFGKISQKHGGYRGIRCPSSELWNVLRIYAEAATTSQEIRGQVILYVRNQPRLVELNISMDDTTNIIVERGRLFQDDPEIAAELAKMQSVNATQAAANSQYLSLARDLSKTS